MTTGPMTMGGRSLSTQPVPNFPMAAATTM